MSLCLKMHNCLYLWDISTRMTAYSERNYLLLSYWQDLPLDRTYMRCDQAKSVWSWSNSVSIFLTNCMHHFHSYILQKTPLKLVNWFQRYEQLKDAKNNRKQKFLALFGSTLKSICPTSNWFCLITFLDKNEITPDKISSLITDGALAMVGHC